ncbi:MAG TPA: hypothetical protein VGP47_03990 [Parachlamydiaceae bacterium]|nr:hypothetical protein [Parachlamydiaceae bacterium]
MNQIGLIPNNFASSNQIEVAAIKISSEKQPYDEFHFRRRYINALQKVASEWSKAKLSDQEYFKILFSEPSFKLKRMNEQYSEESISYFTEQGLEDKQVYLINGLIYNTDLSLYNSRKPLATATGDGEMIVMDRLGSIFIAPKERGILHHSSFFSGKSVAFAALCFIEDGKIQSLVRYSGHYNPGEDEEHSFINQLQTNYLVSKHAFNALKIDSKGSLVQTISISSKEKIEDLYDAIAELGGFLRPGLRLISDSKSVTTAKFLDQEVVDITVAESNLKSGSTIYALEMTHIPHHRIYPISKFELLIND